MRSIQRALGLGDIADGCGQAGVAWGEASAGRAEPGERSGLRARPALSSDRCLRAEPATCPRRDRASDSLAVRSAPGAGLYAGRGIRFEAGTRLGCKAGFGERAGFRERTGFGKRGRLGARADQREQVDLG